MSFGNIIPFGNKIILLHLISQFIFIVKWAEWIAIVAIFQFLSRRRETGPWRIVIRRRYLACVYFSWLSVFSSFYPQWSSPKWPATWTDASTFRLHRFRRNTNDLGKFLRNAISRVVGRKNNNTAPWPLNRKRFEYYCTHYYCREYLLEYPLQK